MTLYQQIDRCLAWVNEKSTRRIFEMEIDTYLGSGKISFRIRDYDIVEGAFLPEDFSGDISKYLCQKKQEELQALIDDSQVKLDKMKEGGCY